MAASFVKQMGNIEFLILSIGGVVFFTLLLVTGNTMAIAVRERTGELAVLKTVGYRRRLRARPGAGRVAGHRRCWAASSGLALAKAFTLRRRSHRRHAARSSTCRRWRVAAGLRLTVAVGVLAGLIPALSAMRLRVVDALRKV